MIFWRMRKTLSLLKSPTRVRLRFARRSRKCHSLGRPACPQHDPAGHQSKGMHAKDKKSKPRSRARGFAGVVGCQSVASVLRDHRPHVEAIVDADLHLREVHAEAKWTAIVSGDVAVAKVH